MNRTRGDSSKLNVRQTLEQHRQNPGCAGCHALFDAYGLALEKYDAIGLYRSTYEDGTPVDVSVTFPPSETHPTGVTIEGSTDCLRRFRPTPLRRVPCQKAVHLRSRRTMTASDEPHLERARGNGSTRDRRRAFVA